MIRNIFFISFIFCFISFSFSQPSGDLITNLPGLVSTPNFNQYSGYINVTGYGQVFYWFVDSQQNPVSDPVVLWLNGGPGCSSLGGLLSENGPWSPNASLSLVPNPYSWNRIANVLYLESPPGVGFSINEAQFSVYTDNLTADANYQFLQGWFSSFSNYQQNDFWITGESYAGHYIPTLVDKILAEDGTPGNIHLNLQGMAIGNPSTDFAYDTGTYYDDYFTSHGLSCLDSSLNGINWNGIINPYDILADVCYEVDLLERIRFPNPTIDKLKEAMKIRNEYLSKQRDVPEQPPCIGNFVTDYLNQASVQSAIHAVPTNWEQCGGPRYQFGQESIIPYYQEFLSTTNLRVFIYSGDEDTVLPFIGTEKWVLSLNQPNVNTWGPWYSNWNNNGPQVAGYWINMGNLWYATVKGAGHMVPWFQPGPAFDLFERYITGQQLHVPPF